MTAVPKPSPPPSMKIRPSVLSSTATSLASPSYPSTCVASSASSFIAQSKCSAPPASKTDHNHITLLSLRDPLLSPIISTNFKRFESIIGPVFWLQDRVEEIIVWKTGPIRPLIWMAASSSICAFVSSSFLFSGDSYQVFPRHSSLDASFHFTCPRHVSVSFNGR